MASKKTSKKKPAAKAKTSSKKKPVKKASKPAKKAKKPSKPVKKAKPKAKAKPAKKKPSRKLSGSKSKPKSKPKAKAKTNTKKKKVVAKKGKKPVKKAAKKIIKKKIAKKVAKKKIVKKPAKKAAKPKKIVKKPAPKLKKPTKPVKAAPKKPAKSSVPVVKGKTAKKVAMEVEKVKGKPGRKSKKTGGDEDEPKMDDLDPLLEEIISVKKKGKQPKAPKIPSPIKLIPTVKIEAVEKEHIIPQKNFRSGGKEKFEMEFFIKSSPRILYNFISSPSGLSEWFSDDVNIKNGIYTFFWEDSSETAKLLATREFELMRFKWSSTDDDDTYFEMKIKIDELTGDVALIITDFAKKEELNDAQRLWDAQIHDLCKAIGS